MSGTLTKSDKELQSLKSDENLVALQEALGVEFEVWTRDSGNWTPATDSLNNNYEEWKVDPLLEQSYLARSPQVHRIDSDSHMVVVPLSASYSGMSAVASTVVSCGKPGMLLYAIKKMDLCKQQQQELHKLRDENAIFLQQVSEDFEELTFLRAMAENLTLKDDERGLARMTRETLALLGHTAGIESLYFIKATDSGHAQVQHQWRDDGVTLPEIPHGQIEELVDKLSSQSLQKPIVKNSHQEGEWLFDLPGAKHVILVPVTTNATLLGWLLALNRSKRRVSAAMESRGDRSQNELGTREASLLSTASAMLASHAHNMALLEEREALMVSVVRTLVSAVDSRDPYTCGHSERVALFAKRLSEEFDFDEAAREKLYLTGLLHDIGKIGISDNVLKKCGPLTDEEYAEIKRHPDLGWAILRDLEHFRYVLPGVLHHHERIDGKGYPDGLTGEDTPFEGRLLAVVDAFDAMTSDRPYRKGMPVEKACAILADGAGTQWDETIVQKFLDILTDIEEIRTTYSRPPLPPRKLQETSSAIIPNAELVAAE